MMPTVTQIRKSAASASHCTVSKYAVYANCPFFDLCTGSGPLRSWYLGDEKNLEALTPFNGAPVPSPNSLNVTTATTRLPPICHPALSNNVVLFLQLHDVRNRREKKKKFKERNR